MYSVILHVTGGTYSLGNIPANASKSVQVAVTGESHIELSQAQGKRLILNVYLEPGYHSNISANVTTDSVLFVDQNYNINPL